MLYKTPDEYVYVLLGVLNEWKQIVLPPPQNTFDKGSKQTYENHLNAQTRLELDLHNSATMIPSELKETKTVSEFRKTLL